MGVKNFGQINTLPEELLEKFPNQTFNLYTPFGVITGIYSDEEFSLDNMLQTKTVGEILENIEEKVKDAVSDLGEKAQAMVNLYEGIKKGFNSAKEIASGGREQASPWLTWKKVIAHSHGAITLNFLVTEKIKTSTEILNNLSLQSINDLGMWSYYPTDVLSDFFSGKSSVSSSKNSKQVGKKIDSKIEGLMKKRLFRLTLGNWFDSSYFLLVAGCNYSIKTATFKENGSPEYLKVTVRLTPARNIGADAYNKWFKMKD